MNPNISKLFAIAQKNERLIIGLMSGTSVDGLDVALCKITGSGSNTNITILQFETVAYTNEYRENVAALFSKKTIDLQALCLTNEWIGIQHGKLILQCLHKWNITPHTIDAIASHGQTIYHAPLSLHGLQAFGNGTLQLGDGDHIAVTTGITTLSDFRQKHIAAGGEGAPLAVYGDYLIFGSKTENRILLNIGGIANFTYLPSTLNMGEVYSTDIGPGNTIMDAYCKQYYNCNYDHNAEIATQGIINNELLAALENESFLQQKFPKTTGPELFNLHYLHKAQVATSTELLSNIDVMRTLNQFTANCIINALKIATSNNATVTVYSSGGGMHNPLLMHTLTTAMPNITFKTTNHLAINPDAKEAVLFAVLANEALVGNNQNFNTNRTDIPAVSMGKISFAQ